MPETLSRWWDQQPALFREREHHRPLHCEDIKEFSKVAAVTFTTQLTKRRLRPGGASLESGRVPGPDHKLALARVPTRGLSVPCLPPSPGSRATRDPLETSHLRARCTLRASGGRARSRPTRGPAWERGAVVYDSGDGKCATPRTPPKRAAHWRTRVGWASGAGLAPPREAVLPAMMDACGWPCECHSRDWTGGLGSGHSWRASLVLPLS